MVKYILWMKSAISTFWNESKSVYFFNKYSRVRGNDNFVLEPHLAMFRDFSTLGGAGGHIIWQGWNLKLHGILRSFSFKTNYLFIPG